MSKVTRPVFPATQRRSEELGERVRTARVRRRITASEMAQRVDVSRATLQRLERGDPSVGMVVLLRVLDILGLAADVDTIARDDELGHRLQDAALTRPRRHTQRQAQP